jgi:hypothetical protein
MAASSSAAASADVIVIDVEETGVVTFDGASEASKVVALPKYECKRCKYQTSKYSEMAYLTPDNAFARTMNTQVSHAMEQLAEAGFRNSVGEQAVCLTCVRCCEQLHGKTYTNEKGVTSQFGNLAKLSKNCRIPDKKLQKIIGSISEKCVRKGEDKLDADKVIKMFQAPELVGSTRSGRASCCCTGTTNVASILQGLRRG